MKRGNCSKKIKSKQLIFRGGSGVNTGGGKGKVGVLIGVRGVVFGVVEVPIFADLFEGGGEGQGELVVAIGGEEEVSAEQAVEGEAGNTEQAQGLVEVLESRGGVEEVDLAADHEAEHGDLVGETFEVGGEGFELGGGEFGGVEAVLEGVVIAFGSAAGALLDL
jgi:hypothetical protein